MWALDLQQAQDRRKSTENLQLFGSDIDEIQIKATLENLETAGLTNLANLSTVDILDLPAPAPEGVLITNPPYGVRLGEESELSEWYPKIGDHLKKNFAGWRCYFFTGDPELPKQFGLKASKRTVLMNGDIECRLLEYQIIAGFNRKDKTLKKPEIQN